MNRGHDYAVGEMITGTPYRVTENIAAGGMGAVYEVEDVGVGKRFALKTLHAELVGDVATEQRMRDEALTLGRLRHANVVQVFTAGVTQDSFKRPFIVMERLFGSTLRALIKERGALGLATTSLITLQLLGALDEAHDLRLVHRDIKPDNVFLHRARRGQLVTKLLDFGVADLVSKANEKPNLFFGTFRYASPEQLKSIPISQSSDLYTVGLLVYEMLAGSHPFAHAASRLAIVEAHLTETPKLPEAWPASIRSILAAALEKDPAKRPKDAFTFAAKFRQAARDLGVDTEAALPEDLFAKLSMAADDAATNPTRSAPLADPSGPTLSAPLNEPSHVQPVDEGEATTQLSGVEVVVTVDPGPATRRIAATRRGS